MIPRYQRVIFWVLVSSILVMSVFLIRGCARSSARLSANEDETPLAAPSTTSTETLTLDVANDFDGSITAVGRELALPQEPSVRARALLDHLLGDYALPDSTHRLPSGPADDDVFFLAIPASALTAAAQFAPLAPQTVFYNSSTSQYSAGNLAVVNLRGAFADSHPSGVLVEDLTVRSIIGTLHANFPDVQQVRFLVDGQQRTTLAGHADLLRTYPAIDTASRPLPLVADPGEQR